MGGWGGRGGRVWVFVSGLQGKFVVGIQDKLWTSRFRVWTMDWARPGSGLNNRFADSSTARN